MELYDFNETNTAFVAYGKLFLEKSLGTHFFQLWFPKVRPEVL
jgi:hypothetical protein